MADKPYEEQILGHGLAFPLRLNARGQLAMTSGVDTVEKSIRIILATSPGDRVKQPEFGCYANTLLFEPRNMATEGLLITYVREALARWEPRIEVTEVRVDTFDARSGAWLVHISYRLLPMHDVRSLVYPFFVQTAEQAD